ncbi:MAG: fumarylacetoacetate hydrolase family protein [Alphaproteobacteria bacterium]
MSLTAPAVIRAADLLAGARSRGNVLEALPQDCRPTDEHDAYAIQARGHELARQAGRGARVGWKIGCTTPVMQELVGVDSPCAGGVLADALFHQQASFDLKTLRRPGIECEIAVRLASDADAGPYDAFRVAGHVAEVMAAMEVVDDRYADFRALTGPDLIADDFFQAACLLGPAVSDWSGLDLTRLAGRTTVNGEPRGQGVGADVMGHPFAALAWLADLRLRQGSCLKAGDVVLTGSVVATQWLDGPATAVTEIEGLGSVTARFK